MKGSSAPAADYILAATMSLGRLWRGAVALTEPHPWRMRYEGRTVELVGRMLACCGFEAREIRWLDIDWRAAGARPGLAALVEEVVGDGVGLVVVAVKVARRDIAAAGPFAGLGACRARFGDAEYMAQPAAAAGRDAAEHIQGPKQRAGLRRGRRR